MFSGIIEGDQQYEMGETVNDVVEILKFCAF